MSVHCLCDLDLYKPQFVTQWLYWCYLSELEIKDTTDVPKWTNYLDLHLEFDEDGKLFTRLYHKRDDFDFPIVNFPYLRCNIPESPAYGVFVSQLIRYARVCSKYEDVLILIERFIEDLFWFQSYWRRDIPHGNITLLFGNSMVVIQTLFTNWTPLCHICWRVC